MMMTAVIASGGLPGVTGMLMKINVNLMFYWLVGLALLMYFDLQLVFKGLEETVSKKR